MTKEEILIEYQSLNAKRRFSSIFTLIASVICLGVGISGTVFEQVSEFGSVEYYKVFLFLGSGALGGYVCDRKYQKREDQLLKLLMAKSDIVV